MRVALGLAALFLASLFLTLCSAAPGRAAAGTVYVDRAYGQDASACGSADTPCQSISYALANRAREVDALNVVKSTWSLPCCESW